MRAILIVVAALDVGAFVINPQWYLASLAVLGFGLALIKDN